jgi:hypothetical protein
MHLKLVQADIRKLVDDNIEFRDESIQNGIYRDKFLLDKNKICIDKNAAICDNKEKKMIIEEACCSICLNIVPLPGK